MVQKKQQANLNAQVKQDNVNLMRILIILVKNVPNVIYSATGKLTESKVHEILVILKLKHQQSASLNLLHLM